MEGSSHVQAGGHHFPVRAGGETVQGLLQAPMSSLRDVLAQAERRTPTASRSGHRSAGGAGDLLQQAPMPPVREVLQQTIYQARTRQTIAGRIRFSMLHDLEPEILKLPESRYRLPNSKAG